MEALLGALTGTVLGTLVLVAGAVLILWILVKLFSLPVKLVYNGLVGGLMLWLVNLVGGLIGFTIKITVFKALIAGFCGVPGAIAVILYEAFVK